MKATNILIKKAVLLIWALWGFFVSLSNICDGLKTIGILPDSFKFVSGNFSYIQAATQIYAFPIWLNAILFILVILWEVTLSFFFFKAFLKIKESSEVVLLPFLLGIILFGGFLVMDEFLIAYDRLGAIEQSHLGFLIGFIVSLLLVRNLN